MKAALHIPQREIINFVGDPLVGLVTVTEKPKSKPDLEQAKREITSGKWSSRHRRLH